MRRATSTKSDPWASALSRALTTSDKLPSGDGWLTFRELKDKYGWGEKRLRNALHAMIKDGRADRFRGLQSNGESLNNQTWYKLK